MRHIELCRSFRGLARSRAVDSAEPKSGDRRAQSSAAQDFAADEVFAVLAAADDAECFAFDENFGGARARVVIRRLHGSVSARSPDDQKVAGFYGFERPIAGQEIAR